MASEITVQLQENNVPIIVTDVFRDDAVLSVRIKGDQIGPQTGDVVLEGTTFHDWEPNTDYVKDEVVFYNGRLYRSKGNHTSGTTFTPDNWQEMDEVDLIVPDFQPNYVYEKWETCVYGGKIYRAISAFTSTGSWTASNWEEISSTLLPVFEANTFYEKDTPIFEDGKIYKTTNSFTSTDTFSEGDWTFVTNSFTDEDMDAVRRLDTTIVTGATISSTTTTGTLTLNLKNLWTGLASSANVTIPIADLTKSGFMTPAQVQKLSDLETSLENKVDKEAGKGLSANDYTTEEKEKLAGLDSSNFKGRFNSESELILAYPIGQDGWYAEVIVGGVLHEFIWDDINGEWVDNGATGGETAASIKQKYESNPDTNAFTDSEKTKLSGIETGAEVNVQSDWNQTDDTADDYIKNKPVIPEGEGSGVPIVPISKSGDNYIGGSNDIDMDTIELGQPIILIPTSASTSTTMTLEINSSGNPMLFQRKTSDGSIIPLDIATIFKTGTPVLITYTLSAWVIMDSPKPRAEDLSGSIPVTAGGTGGATFTPGSVLLGNGTSPFLEIPSTTTQGLVLTTNTNGVPSYQTPPSADAVTSYEGPASLGGIDYEVTTYTNPDSPPAPHEGKTVLAFLVES